MCLESPSRYSKEPYRGYGWAPGSLVFPKKDGHELRHGFDERITQEVVENGNAGPVIVGQVDVVLFYGEIVLLEGGDITEAGKVTDPLSYPSFRNIEPPGKCFVGGEAAIDWKRTDHLVQNKEIGV